MSTVDILKNNWYYFIIFIILILIIGLILQSFITNITISWLTTFVVSFIIVIILYYCKTNFKSKPKRIYLNEDFFD